MEGHNPINADHDELARITLENTGCEWTTRLALEVHPRELDDHRHSLFVGEKMGWQIVQLIDCPIR